MTRPKQVGDPIQEAVDLLASGTAKASEMQIRAWLAESVEKGQVLQGKEASMEARRAVDARVRQAASDLTQALEDLRDLAPPKPFVLDPGRWDDFSHELHTLSHWGFVALKDERRAAIIGDVARMLPGGGPKVTKKGKVANRPPLPVPVLRLHMEAVRLLKLAGIPATSGTGANVAQLGALLCAAAGLPLKDGESTDAARKALNYSELFRSLGM